jgi:hypothetical protein
MEEEEKEDSPLSSFGKEENLDEK